MREARTGPSPLREEEAKTWCYFSNALVFAGEGVLYAPSSNPSRKREGNKTSSHFNIDPLIARIFLCTSSAAIAEPPAPPTAVTAVKILSGDEFILSDGHTVKLAAISAPFPETQVLADQSRQTLEGLIGKSEPVLENISMDRYGRLSAQAFISQENNGRIWLQEKMLREGMAFIYPPTGQEPGLDKLFAAEAEARAAKRGIWADEFYADTPDTKAWQKYGHFAFVSGTVLKAERVKDKVYLNFGADWRKDFTIMIAAHDLASFRKAGIDPLAYEGKTIRGGAGSTATMDR